MDALTKSLWLGAGAFLGANMRFWLGEWMDQRGAIVFPWETFLINVSGSILIGIFYAFELRYTPNFAYRLFLAVGICGGFTTFSTFSWETLRMMEKGQWGIAGLYVAASVILTISGCYIGFALARTALGG